MNINRVIKSIERKERITTYEEKLERLLDRAEQERETTLMLERYTARNK
jgi:hypothetical protein